MYSTWYSNTCKILATAGCVLMLQVYELIENNTVLITEDLGIGVNLFCYNINLFSLKA